MGNMNNESDFLEKLFDKIKESVRNGDKETAKKIIEKNLKEANKYCDAFPMLFSLLTLKDKDEIKSGDE